MIITSNPLSPQLEHGYTRIVNALLEALMRYPFSGGELRVIIAVIRLTYGWRKKSAPISTGQIARMTGMSHRHVKRLIADLIKAGVLTRAKVGRRNLLGPNKCYWLWLWKTFPQVGNPDTQQVTGASPREGTSLSPLIKKEKEINL